MSAIQSPCQAAVLAVQLFIDERARATSWFLPAKNTIVAGLPGELLMPLTRRTLLGSTAAMAVAREWFGLLNAWTGFPVKSEH